MKSDREAWPRLGITESEGPGGLSGTDHNVCGAGWTAGFMAISLSLPRAPRMNPTMPPQGAPQGRALGRVTSGPQDQEGLLQLASLLPLQDNRRLSSPPRHLRLCPASNVTPREAGKGLSPLPQKGKPSAGPEPVACPPVAPAAFPSWATCQLLSAPPGSAPSSSCPTAHAHLLSLSRALTRVPTHTALPHARASGHSVPRPQPALSWLSRPPSALHVLRALRPPPLASDITAAQAICSPSHTHTHTQVAT